MQHSSHAYDTPFTTVAGIHCRAQATHSLALAMETACGAAVACHSSQAMAGPGDEGAVVAAAAERPAVALETGTGVGATAAAGTVRAGAY